MTPASNLPPLYLILLHVNPKFRIDVQNCKTLCTFFAIVAFDYLAFIWNNMQLLVCVNKTHTTLSKSSLVQSSSSAHNNSYVFFCHVHKHDWCGGLVFNVQDRSLQCPSNAIWPFKMYLSQNSPSKHNPNLKMKTSLEILNINMPTTTTNEHRALSQQEVEFDAWFLILHIVLETHTI